MQPLPQYVAKPGLLIVDDDPLICESLKFILARDFAVDTVGSRHEAVALLRARHEPPALALVDLGLPPVPQLPNEGLNLIGDLLAHAPATRILVLTGQNQETNARRARALGAMDLVPKPCAPEMLRKFLLDALAMPLGERFKNAAGDATEPILGESAPMQKLRQQVAQYANAQFPVLIEGESGSGKELIAAQLHHLSTRADEPMLALNCAAISPQLVEATLFGYARGAFTGATAAKAGYFEDAGAGTLFLDEIGELPADFQAKLLRVLENGAYQRIGETQSRSSRARIVAATNRDLRHEVKAGRFRADLFHRLSVLAISAPPLRDLGADRLVLLEHYRGRCAAQTGATPFELDDEARAAWLAYDFPGNARELRNIVVRLTTKHPGYKLGVAQLREEFDLSPWAGPPQPDARPPREAAKARLLREQPFSLPERLRSEEQAYIDAAMELAAGNISQAAKLLGVNRTTLYGRMEALGCGAKIDGKP